MSIDQIRSAIERAMRGIRWPYRATINLVNNKASNQLAQIGALAGETLPGVELLQQFGFCSNPPEGTQAIVLPLGGKTQHSIIIATDNGAYRIKELASGEVALYNQRGDYVILRQSGVTEVNCKKLIINAPEGVEINAAAGVHIDAPQCKVTGTVVGKEVQDQDGAKSMSSMRGVFNPHTHKPNNGPPKESQ